MADEEESPMHLITIAFVDNDTAPGVDLGGCSPFLAIGVLEEVLGALRTHVPVPTISYQGEVVFDGESLQWSYEDEDDEAD